MLVVISLLKRGEDCIYNGYVIGHMRKTLAKAQGNSAEEVLYNLLHITTVV